MKINLLTIASEAFKELENLTLPSKKEYCDRWGLKLDARTHSPPTLFVNGREAIREERDKMPMDSLKSCDWLFFMGCDTVITNMTTDVRKMIKSFGDVDFVIGRDFYGINNDVFFLRNSKASFLFLEELLKFKTKNDQIEMKMVMDGNIIPNFKYLIVSQKLFNAYPEMEYYRKTMKPACHFEEKPDNISQWEVGDFVAHYPGMGLEQRLLLIPFLLEKIIR